MTGCPVHGIQTVYEKRDGEWVHIGYRSRPNV